jgi:phosphoribosylglycinamide formyltransferase-1
MTDEFVGDPLVPEAGSFDPDRMASGEPGVPSIFHWHGEPVAVLAVVRSWKDTASCRHGSGEQYVNKHWYELATDRGTMTVYFERRLRRGSRSQARWWLYSIRRPQTAVAELPQNPNRKDSQWPTN